MRCFRWPTMNEVMYIDFGLHNEPIFTKVLLQCGVVSYMWQMHLRFNKYIL